MYWYMYMYLQSALYKHSVENKSIMRLESSVKTKLRKNIWHLIKGVLIEMSFYISGFIVTYHWAIWDYDTDFIQ